MAECLFAMILLGSVGRLGKLDEGDDRKKIAPPLLVFLKLQHVVVHAPAIAMRRPFPAGVGACFVDATEPFDRILKDARFAKHWIWSAAQHLLAWGPGFRELFLCLGNGDLKMLSKAADIFLRHLDAFVNGAAVADALKAVESWIRHC